MNTELRLKLEALMVDAFNERSDPDDGGHRELVEIIHPYVEGLSIDQVFDLVMKLSNAYNHLYYDAENHVYVIRSVEGDEVWDEELAA